MTVLDTAVLLAVLDKFVPEFSDDAEEVGEVRSPKGDWSWASSDLVCRYVDAMVDGWSTDVPKKGRHPWCQGQATRLAAARRYGCLTEADHTQAVQALTDRFAILCVAGIGGPRRAVQPGEVRDMLSWGVRKIEAKTDAEVAAELGNHEHCKNQRLTDLEDRVFKESDTLKKIRQAARARMVSPWAVLGSVLARISSEIPPDVTLPPIIGSRASLNLAVGLVGKSGEGKSMAHHVAGDLMPLAGFATRIGPGSGEGIIQAFLQWDPKAKKNVPVQPPQALLYADEVEQVGAVQSRNGSTFGPTIRSMLSGTDASTTNAEASRKRRLPAHTYRLAVVAGIQPEKSDILLNESDAGTPQRWLWLPALDPDMPDIEPRWPGEITWTHNAKTTMLTVPDSVAQFIKQQHRSRHRGNGDALNSHAVLTRLRVAALLSLLHCTVGVTERWWDVAGLIMDGSDRVREQCVQVLAARTAAEQRSRGAGDAARESGRREAVVAENRTLSRLLWQQVHQGSANGHSNQKHKTGEGCTRRCLTYALRNHKGADRDGVIAEAQELGWIECRNDRWFPGPSQPADE